MSQFKGYLFDNNDNNLAHIINTANAGIWELDVDTKYVKWSVNFFGILGYNPGEIECSYINFIDNLLYYEDKTLFLKSINDAYYTSTDTVEIRLLTKNGYEWFLSKFQKNGNSGQLVGTITNINRFKISEFSLQTDKQFMTETNKLAKFARWDIDVANNELRLSDQALEILDVEAGVQNIDQFVTFFESQSRQQISAAIEACIINCRPFNFDVKLITAAGSVKWVKIKAVAKIDTYGKCLAVMGILQDIDVAKQNENELTSSLHDVSLQNKRLENFAYIVSHNLRSYVGNLQIMVNLHDEATESNDRSEIFGHIKTVTKTLSTMIQHLNEIVNIDSLKQSEQTVVEFDLLFKNIINALQPDIETAGAVITSDFSNCPSVIYLPAYLDSIFHNLLTNALKYRHPGRRTSISCESKLIGGHVYLIFEDNGLGMDMKKYGDKVFGMYQTFHKNPDAQGIGLYITRNQIEALGGSISVESTLTVGTRFNIRLT